jgi:hypothetical protein
MSAGGPSKGSAQAGGGAGARTGTTPGKGGPGSDRGQKLASTSGSSATSTSGTSTTTTTTGTTATTAALPNALSTKIGRNPPQLARIEAMLPAGMTIEDATAGVRNQGQFIAALNASKNQGISFADLQTAMTVDGLSLGQAVKQLRGATTPPATSTDGTTGSTTGSTAGSTTGSTTATN